MENLRKELEDEGYRLVFFSGKDMVVKREDSDYEVWVAREEGEGVHTWDLDKYRFEFICSVPAEETQ